MGPLIDVVGHFGTTFSYATVASNVARGLRERKLLGSVWNMDAEWHSAFDDLRSITMGLMPATLVLPRGTHVAVFTVPFHYMDVYPTLYGREHSAIFMSPNTDRLATEHAETCGKFGLAMVPSAWCASVVREAVDAETQVAMLPLGVAASYAAGRKERAMRLAGRAHGQCHVVHVSTDQMWPGRKGTEELLAAWAILCEWGRVYSARLTVHVPPGLLVDAMYRVRDWEIDESVTIVTGDERGSEDDPLLALFDSADLIVAPSRCEGFGMMLLGALVAGVPLVSTYVTGHSDFLTGATGWLGIPTAHLDTMHGEEGLAPTIEPEVLAQMLSVALRPEARMALLEPALSAKEDEWGTWPPAVRRWTDRLAEWAEETT